MNQQTKIRSSRSGELNLSMSCDNFTKNYHPSMSLYTYCNFWIHIFLFLSNNTLNIFSLSHSLRGEWRDIKFVFSISCWSAATRRSGTPDIPIASAEGLRVLQEGCLPAFLRHCRYTQFASARVSDRFRRALFIVRRSPHRHY